MKNIISYECTVTVEHAKPSAPQGSTLTWTKVVGGFSRLDQVHGILHDCSLVGLKSLDKQVDVSAMLYTSLLSDVRSCSLGLLDKYHSVGVWRPENTQWEEEEKTACMLG